MKPFRVTWADKENKLHIEQYASKFEAELRRAELERDGYFASVVEMR